MFVVTFYISFSLLRFYNDVHLKVAKVASDNTFTMVTKEHT